MAHLSILPLPKEQDAKAPVNYRPMDLLPRRDVPNAISEMFTLGGIPLNYPTQQF
jgi:hypothetical protein